MKFSNIIPGKFDLCHTNRFKIGIFSKHPNLVDLSYVIRTLDAHALETRFVPDWKGFYAKKINRLPRASHEEITLKPTRRMQYALHVLYA